MLKIAVLISGEGSNLQAILDAIRLNQWPIEVVCVLSDKEEAYGLVRARRSGIPTEIVLKENFTTRAEFDRALVKKLQPYQPEWIALAGFMRVLGHDFLAAFPDHILNIHPSLLPKYPGLHTHEQVLANQDKEHGATVHLVNEVLDGGKILAQSSFLVSPTDTVSSLRQKVQQVEHRIYPQVLYTLVQ